MKRVLFIASLILCGFESSLLFSQDTSSPPSESETETPPIDPIVQERIDRAIQRMGYLVDMDVVKLGIDQIRKLLAGGLTWTPVDFSQNLILRDAIVLLLQSGSNTPIVSDFVRLEAAKLLGEAKLVIHAHEVLMSLSQDDAQIPIIEAATKSYAQATKSLPDSELVNFLIQKDRMDFLRELAEIVPDDGIVSYLVNRFVGLQRPEKLYGIDHPLAADVAVQDFLTQFVVPSAPTSITAEAVFDPKGVTLVWMDTSLNESSFVIERSTDNLIWAQLKEVGNNQISFVDDKVDVDIQYYYRVYARNHAGVSEVSPVTTAIVMTPPPPPSEPPPTEEPPVEEPPVEVPPTEEPPVEEDPPVENPPTQEPPPSRQNARRGLEVPPNPPPREGFDMLAKKLRGWIGGAPHLASIQALLRVIEEGQGKVSMASSDALGLILTRQAFDWSPEVTSVSLKVLKEVERRANRDALDYSLTATERKEYPIRHRAVGNKLTQVFYGEFK